MIAWLFPSQNGKGEEQSNDTQLAEALNTLTDAESAEDMQQVLETWYSTLTSEKALITLILTFTQEYIQDNEQLASLLQQCLSIIEYAREHDVPQAFQLFLAIENETVDAEALTIPLPRIIELLIDTLASIAQTEHPLLYAHLCHTLGDNYAVAFDTFAEEAYIEQAITSYTTALDLLPKETSPTLWGYVHMRRGIVSMHRPQGELLENLDFALADFDAALQTVTQTETPYEWAITHLHRGHVYLEIQHGERSDNIEQAIVDLEAALTVIMQEDNPPTWASIHQQLANAYTLRMYDQHTRNLQRAIAEYTEALAVFTCEDAPYEYREIHSNLATIYVELDKTQEAQEAFAIVRTTTQYLEQLAQAQMQENANEQAPLSSPQETLDPEMVASTVEAFLTIPDMTQMYNFLLAHQDVLLSKDAIDWLRLQLDQIQATNQDGRAEYLEIHLYLLEYAQSHSIEAAWQHYLTQQLPAMEATTLLSTAKSLNEVVEKIAAQQELFTSPTMLALLYRVALNARNTNNALELQQIEQSISMLKKIRTGQIPFPEKIQAQTYVTDNQTAIPEHDTPITISPADLARFNMNDPFWQLIAQEMLHLPPETIAVVMPFFAQIGAITHMGNVAALSQAAQQILERFDYHSTPYLWAAFHWLCITNFFIDPQADPQQALDHCEAALSVINRDLASTSWAILLLTRSYICIDMLLNKARGLDKAEHEWRIQHAITDLNTIEAFFSPQDSPFEWALVRATRGFACAELEQTIGNSGYSSEQILADLEVAIPVLVSQNRLSPLQYIRTYMYRAIILYRYQGGDRQKNIERAIGDCDIVITHCQPPMSRDIAECWANALVVRGLAYMDRVSGGPRDNGEQALKSFDRALTVYTRKDFPRDWAMTLINRANAFMQRAEGDRTQNLENSLRDYDDALTFFQPEGNSLQLGQALLNRSLCYQTRILGNKVQNQEKALADCEAALAIFKQMDLRNEWATALANRATLFMQRLAGDRQENLKHALADCNDALQVFSRAETPQWWAKTLVNRGTIHRALAMMIGLTQRAVGMRTILERLFSQHPESMTALLNENNQHFEQALADFSAALTVLTRESAPREWATVLRERAGTYALQTKGYFTGEKEEYIRRGLLDYDNALTVFSRHETPYEWAIIMSNRAILHNELASKERRDEAKHVLADTQAALEVYTRQIAPANYRRIQQIRADVFRKLEHWAEMHEALSNARLVQRDLMATAASSQEQADVIAEFAPIDVYAQDVKAMLHLAHPDYAEIAIALEEGRAQSLRSTLDLDTVRLEHIKSPEAQERMKQFRTALNQWRKAQNHALHSPTDSQQQKGVHNAYITFTQAREYIRQHDNPDFMTPVPTLDSIMRALRTTDEALVYLIAGSHVIETEGIALVIMRDSTGISLIRHIPLPRLTELMLFDLMEIKHDTAPTIRITEAIATLGERGLDHIVELLLRERIRKVRLIPYNWLGLFPLPAIMVLSHNGKRRHMSDLFEEVTIVPSAHAMEMVNARIAARNNERRVLLIAGNPQPHPPGVADLPFAEAEADTIRLRAQRYGYPSTQIGYLNPYKATRERMLEALPTARYAHLALHGQYRVNEPRRSRLLLAGNPATPEQKRSIYLGEMLDGAIDLQGLRLLVLSACETSITDMQRVPNEVLGLATGFLQAGAAGVIAALWAVDDRATYLLMSRFAQLYLDPQGLWSPARALAEAQRWLREEATNNVLAEYDPLSSATPETSTQRSVYDRYDYSTIKAIIQKKASQSQPDTLPYADPFYWAAFVVTGR